MLIFVASPSAILRGGTIATNMINVMVQMANQGNRVHLISNKNQPPWFDTYFRGSPITFIKARGRQSGQIIKEMAEYYSTETHNILALAMTQDDIRMAKNGKAVTIGAEWSTDTQVSSLGL